MSAKGAELMDRPSLDNFLGGGIRNDFQAGSRQHTLYSRHPVLHSRHPVAEIAYVRTEIAYILT